MMLQLPTILAVAGTVLMAIVIFAPRRVTVSAAGPFAPTFVPAAGTLTASALVAPERIDPRRTLPVWPEFIDARAARCDAAARLTLVDALASLRSEWSRALLTRALDDEDEPAVRRAILQALGGEPA
ncbi:hypothetical protein WPS_17150 [Vulcanimicrobium alpinum]|uniref:HEAT repeat domain-containing protein n=1 Tax=Vulcanimicrobium alpinum TaxID=3016050 RepID=A0AAN1XW23_UNVUL|nr:hypothetical protein [Vulcanimicrobium alpinum]BDE06439.1 hypothetical protein WPS_17150 [Vulcanimicrobium alpinum]